MSQNNTNNAPEQDLNEILRVRREKLAALKEAGNDPFEITKYDFTHDSADIKNRFDELFWAGCCDDSATLETIGDLFDEYGYLCDTHTAVAMNVYKQYIEKTGDDRPTVIASTASPYKFAKSVLSAVSDKTAEDEFGNVRVLSEVTSTAVPAPISALENAEVRFNDTCGRDEMLSAVYKSLGIE